LNIYFDSFVGRSHDMQYYIVKLWQLKWQCPTVLPTPTCRKINGGCKSVSGWLYYFRSY